MRGVMLAVVAWFCMSAAAAAPGTDGRAESAGLRSIAGWLKVRGTPGYLGADVAEAIGIARGAGEALDARQRGYRDADVLRVAQVLDGGYLLFVVQAAGEVYFYLSTVQGGLRKALVSVPSRDYVVPLGANEAAANFRREIVYWEDKVTE